MKLKKIFLAILPPIFIAYSCQKDINGYSSTAALTIVNASAGNPKIIASASDTMVPYYRNQAAISYKSFSESGYSAQKTPLIIVGSADTTVTLFRGNLDLKGGGIYSFFITGQVKAVDTLFIQDNIPSYQDSVAGIRFINLSPGSQPISINLKGNSSTQTEFSSLSYKQPSSFKTYSATNGLTKYNFEIRDQSSGNLLISYAWPLVLRKNQTIIICGSENPSDASPVGVFLVNNY